VSSGKLHPKHTQEFGHNYLEELGIERGDGNKTDLKETR
jgi:hypothetical protein